ncbi:MAG: type IV pilus modification PilV family protein [Candidatus Puniceispirillaceae bacterium]
MFRPLSGLKSGVSTVELLVAMTVLSTAALGVFGLLSNTETNLLSSRNDLNAQQTEEALGAYLYEEFISYDETDPTTGLDDFKEEVFYTRAEFPNTSLRYRSVMGYQKRYAQGAVTAKCRLVAPTNEITGTVSFTSDCVTIPEGAADNQTIAQVINELLHNNVPVSFGVENVGSLCTATTPMDNTTVDPGKTAVLSVDDPQCLNSINAGQPAANSEIIFPRFVVYSPADINRYNTSLIDRPTGKTVGLALDGPAAMSAQSGVSTPETGFTLSSLSDTDSGILTFSSPLVGARLSLSDAHGANLTDNNSATISISGTFGQLKEAIREFFYESPNGYFGSDTVSVVVRSGSMRSAKTMAVDITPNCGDQLLGTATRFDLGYMDNSTGVPFFDETTATFLTTVSVYDNSSPTHFYGYCRPNEHRYDYETQRFETTGGMCDPVSDHGSTRYQKYSSRLMKYDNNTPWNLNSSINVFLYEEADNMTQDRYALFLVLDGYPGRCADATAPTTLADSRSSGNAMTNSNFKALGLSENIWPNGTIKNDSDRRCRLAFRLSNIEPERNLDNTSDLHTFTDDPKEYTGIIGDDGRLMARASWQEPIDGVVVPLRIVDPTHPDNATVPVELRNYTFGNPIFELVFWDTLNSWNIRALDTTLNKIVFRRIMFAPGNDDQTQAIRLNINQSRRCGT